LVNHEAVAEAAVVGIDDEIRARPVAFVILRARVNGTPGDLEKQLRKR